MEVSCGLQDHREGKVLEPKPPPRERHITNRTCGPTQRRIHSSTSTSYQLVHSLFASDIHSRRDN
jgi:hypothetical protein